MTLTIICTPNISCTDISSVIAVSQLVVTQPHQDGRAHLVVLTITHRKTQSPVWLLLRHRWQPGSSGKKCKLLHPGNAKPAGHWGYSRPGTMSRRGWSTPSRGTFLHGRAGDQSPTSTVGSCCLGHRGRDSRLQKSLHAGICLCSSAGWWKIPHLWWWDRHRKQHSLKMTNFIWSFRPQHHKQLYLKE